MAHITIEEATALADQWQAQRDDYDRQPRASYFKDYSPHELIATWETCKRKDGRKLTAYEFGCLVEAWCACFECYPPLESEPAAASSAERQEREPLPADDTMLRMPEVERLTGISKSTIKRMVSDGRFPKPPSRH